MTIEQLREVVKEACEELRWYARRRVDLASQQTFLNTEGPVWHLAKDQACWADALLDEINELEWAVDEKGDV